MQGLALPTAASGPDPLAHQGLYNNNTGATAGGASASASVSGAMESDDEWDEILAQPDRSASSSSSVYHTQQRLQEPLTIMMEDDVDVDDGLDFLERELLGEDEPMGDADADVDEEEDLEEEIIGHVSSSRVGAAAAAAGPMSMNQFAGGDAVVDDDDDDFSSSEESEED